MTELQRQANIILSNIANGTGNKSPLGYKISMKERRVLKARQQEIYGYRRDFNSWLYGPRNDVEEWRTINAALMDAGRERINATSRRLPFYLVGVLAIVLLCIGLLGRIL